MSKNKTIKELDIYALGIMSGTSLDGLDLALCHFQFADGKWLFNIEKAITIDYNDEWKKKLGDALYISGYQLIELHRQFGFYIGESAKEFLIDCKIKPSIIASHGHTVFHEPHKQINFQIGDGAAIASITEITTISDFRSLDINLGGQGAPLVPIGDHLLFTEYDFCINLGGFANISHLNNSKIRLAYDICPVNIILNLLVKDLDQSFDKDGILGQKGKVNKNLLYDLNQIDFYKRNPPKSLGKEWLDFEVIPLFAKSKISVVDKLRTFYEHIAVQITKCLTDDNKNLDRNRNAFLTGGGAHNKFLVELIKSYTNTKIILPEKVIVDYKEALIFAFLGVLRHYEMKNCLKSVTGARFDNVGGQIFIMD